MKKLILSFIFLSLVASTAKGDFMLGTDYPAGTPLTMAAGSTSGLMSVNVSGNTSGDAMLSWQFNLVIAPEGGAAGTLVFQDPGTGIVTNPANYVFTSGNTAGISVTNSGSQLSANDFDYSFEGFSGLGGNLLQMDFLASGDASGVFGIYALEGQANSVWTDSNLNTQLFTNVPDGTGMVLIGEVDVTGGVPSAVPEPSSLTLLVVGGVTLASWRWLRQRKQGAV
jgi:hypothetical protein